jgi:hypothetical protein
MRDPAVDFCIWHRAQPRWWSAVPDDGRSHRRGSCQARRIDRLVGALDQALDDEATRKRMLVLGSDIPDKARRGPEPLLALVKSEIERWTRIIETANVKAE